MLHDDYEKMMTSFKKTINGESAKLDELCQESLDFFQKIQHQIQSGNEREKQEALNMMSSMYETLVKESKKMTESTGMTEEQLVAYAENSKNFDPEQWKLIQETRASMVQAGDTIASYLKEVVAAESPKPAPKKRKKIPRTKRGHWLRS